MSLRMPGSQQRQTIGSKQKKDGKQLETAHPKKFPSLLPEMEGKSFGRLKVVSVEVYRIKNRAALMTECMDCGIRSIKDYFNLTRDKAGCRACARPRRVPQWLWQRCSAAQQRCENQKNNRFRDYGGRGIRFNFSSPLEMALWIQENIGLHRGAQIDRIDNEKGYMPGNLRWSSARMNECNTRRTRRTALMHLFRETHPEIRYADKTLMRMVATMTFSEIIDRYHQKSCKPKGVYGTYSTPDHDIALLSRG